MFIYPSDIINQFRIVWEMRRFDSDDVVPSLPSDQVLMDLFETAYHASLKTEEGRAVRFRLVFCETEEAVVSPRHNVDPPFKYLCPSLVKFETKRGFTVNEILRLAPATNPTKTLIWVAPSSIGFESLEIRGLLEVGKTWWNFLHGDFDSFAIAPPNHLTIASTETGSISLSRRGLYIGGLRDGQILLPVANVFEEGPIANFFSEAKVQMLEEINSKLNLKKFESTEDTISNLYINTLKRLLFNIREKSHGGTLIIVPNDLTITDPRLKDRLSIKYPCEYDSLWETLVHQLLNEDKLQKKRKAKVTPKNFNEYKNLELKSRFIKEPISDSINALATLTNVDGAVIITDKFRLLGFGAEVIASSPSMNQVMIAEDSSGLTGSSTAVESFGTRHRSAFRFCSSYEKAIAFVFSQDGGIKAITRIGPNLVMWSDVFLGGLSI